MGDTTIEWTDETWNPVTGCTKVSQGCKNCYAERLAPKVFAGQMIRDHYREIEPALPPRPRVFTDVLTHPDRLGTPLRWSRPRRVFVNSMSDLFHEDVPDDFIDKVFAAMAMTTRHTFQVLTKRPTRMLEWSTKTSSGATRETLVSDAMDFPDWMPHVRGQSFPRYPAGWPLANVWLGVSVEDQATADERIPLLLQTPAAVRFVSYEPALGPVDFTRLDKPITGPGSSQPAAPPTFHRINALTGFDATYDWHSEGVGNFGPTLDWIIAGGESGPGARPAHPDWFRSVRDQCAAAGVAFFFKQWGEWAPPQVIPPAQWRGPHTYIDDEYVMRAGKKAAGRKLDGREHSEYPA